MTLAFSALTGASLLAAPATQPSGPASPSTAPAQSGAMDVAVDGMLDRTLPEVTFNGVGLDDAIDFFRDVTGAKLEVNWEALQAAGVKKDAPVTIKLANVKSSRALRLVLESAGGKQARLHASVEEGRVLVTTWDDYVAHYTEDRNYDVRDLIVPADPVRKTPGISGEDVVALIQDSTAAGSWLSTGGKPGAIKEKDGRLTVTQTRENHRLIAALIAQIRERRRLGAGISAPAASRPATPTSRPAP